MVEAMAGHTSCPPDESAAPIRVPSAREKLKIPSPILLAFIDCLNSLKWQCNPHWALLLAVLVFPIPNTFCHLLYSRISFVLRRWVNHCRRGCRESLWPPSETTTGKEVG